MNEYDVSELKGCKVNVRATDQATAASGVTYRSPTVVLDSVKRDYNDCIYGCSDQAEAICNDIATYGLVAEGSSSSTPIITAKKVDDCNVIG